MSAVGTVSAKGQITIPKPLREELGLRPGTRLRFQIKKGKLVAEKVMEKDPFQNWVGQAKSRRRKTTDQIVDELRGGPPESWVRKHSRSKEPRKA